MFNLTKILNFFTFIFFGIEESIWNKIDNLEKQKFYRVIIYLIILSVIIFLGMYEFFYLLLSNFLIAIILGIVFSFIFLNIFRFSIFTIQKPIYYEPKIEIIESNKQIIGSQNESTISNINSNAFISKIKKLLFLFFNVFSFEFFTRLIINCILVLFIVLPFSCFLRDNEIDKINTNKRNQLIYDYKENWNRKYKNTSILFDSKIKVLNQKIVLNKNEIYTKELKNELRLKKDILSELDQTRQIEIINFEKKLADKNFLILSYKYISNTNIFIYVLILVVSLFILSHFQKYLLLNPNNNYYILANKLYTQIVLDNYIKNELEIKNNLQKRYKSILNNKKIVDYYESLKENSIYTDPPFNSKMKDHKTSQKKLSSIEFINFFSTK
jgi:hypothetical protein